MTNSGKNKFGSRQQVLSYIRRNRRKQDRSAIDVHLLKMGYDQTLLEKVWWELSLPWWRPTLQKIVFMLCLLWSGLAFWLDFNWYSSEGYLIAPGPPPVWPALLSLVLLGAVYSYRSWLGTSLQIICSVLLLLIFLVCFPWEETFAEVSDRYPMARVSSINTADGHFYLMHHYQMIPLGYYLYQCNTFGFGCQDIKALRVNYDPNCKNFSNPQSAQDHLALGTDGKLKIVNGTTGLTYPDVNRATITINCASQTMAVAPW